MAALAIALVLVLLVVGLFLLFWYPVLRASYEMIPNSYSFLYDTGFWVAMAAVATPTEKTWPGLAERMALM